MVVKKQRLLLILSFVLLVATANATHSSAEPDFYFFLPNVSTRPSVPDPDYWVVTYGESTPQFSRWWARESADGGHMLAGTTASPGAGDDDALLLKLNGDGSVAWQHRYGSSRDEDVRALVTTEGGYVLAGNLTVEIPWWDTMIYPWVFKIQQDGSLDWQTEFAESGFNIVTAIASMDDGGIVLTGTSTAPINIPTLAWVLRLDSAGTILWQKSYGGTTSYVPRSIRETSSGGFVLAGRAEQTGGSGNDMWLMEVDAAGEIIWQRSYGGSGWDEGEIVLQTGDGDYVLAGITTSFRAGDSDVWVLKVDGAGTVLWQKTYGGSATEEATALQETADGGYVLAGTTTSFGAGSTDGWLLKLDSDGSVAWQRSYGSRGADYFSSLQVIAGEGFLLAGSTSLRSGNRAPWVVRPDSAGGIANCGLIQPGTAAVGEAAVLAGEAHAALVTGPSFAAVGAYASRQASDAQYRLYCAATAVAACRP